MILDGEQNEVTFRLHEECLLTKCETTGFGDEKRGQ